MGSVHTYLPLSVLLCVAAVALTAGCNAGTSEPAPRGEARGRAADEPIVIPAGQPLVVGVSAPLTGPDEAVGREDSHAVVVAVERWKRENGGGIKGHDIAVRMEDDGCTETDIAVQAARRLIAEPRLVGVLGPNCSAGALAAVPVYNEAEVVAVSGSATATELTLPPETPDGFFFRTAYRNDLQGVLIGLFASAQLRAQSVYLIDDGEVYGIDLADAAQEAMEANDVLVTRVSVERGAVDFSDLAATIAEAGPAFVGYAGFNPEAALLYRQVRDAGYRGLFGAGDAVASVPDFVEPLGEESEGVLFSGCSPSLPDDFVEDFRRIHGDPPGASTFVAQYADATTVLLDAVAQVAEEEADGSLRIDPIALRDAVAGARLDGGISGDLAFDGNGDRVPAGVVDLRTFVEGAINTGDIDVFPRLGLVPCEVRGGQLVNLLGPGAIIQ